MNALKAKTDPERTARKIVMDCADCDCCRPIMDESCLFFPELYRLYDKEAETGQKPSSDELRQLVDKCNFCALCPCPNIRADIIRAKTQFAERDGLKFGVRAVEDVARIGKICGALPGLANRVLRSKLAGGVIKQALGIHPDRKMPAFPEESFTIWCQRHGLHAKPNAAAGRKAVYFAGCTARYIFPGVARATVDVLRHNGIQVYCPEQKCCGMPSFLEGDRSLTMEFADHNLRLLADAVGEGFDVLCSCPTCSFMLRTLLAEGAYYSKEYQETVGGDPKFIKVPAKAVEGKPEERKLEFFDKTIFNKIMRDEGYFSSLDPLKRVALAEKTFDVGEYLLNLHRSKELKTDFAPIELQAVYFPPCHQREQEFGQPYLELLGLIPGLKSDSIQGNLYCCGLAGVMGFKQDFHEASIQLGRRLMRKIEELHPKTLLTDCLSCRLQFNQEIPCQVKHPIELLAESYRQGQVSASPGEA
ncbi:MAG: heterodisulfide reductase-related iron-sulfur binding cluster [Desulfobacterales bacterium]